VSILFVEDDEASRTTFAAVLQRAGYIVHLAPDFRLALQLLEGDQPIDLLLTDIVMPDRVNGLALARMARLRRPQIKILYMTGYDIPGLEGEALGPILRKPFEDEALLNAVSGALRATSR
jgi:CheY-like chemotaxis protein